MTLMTALTLNASGFNNGIDLAIKDTEDFKKTIGAASVQTIKAFKDISEMGVGEMRRNLRELRNISFAGKSVEEIGAINKQIGILQDTMGDTKALQAGLGTEFGNLATQGIQGMAGIAEAGLGLAMVLGMDKEKAAEYQATMVGVIGAVQGLGEFQEMLGNKVLQSLAIRIKETAVTAAQTVATWAQTAAQWALNASLLVVIGTIGAAVVIVAAITAGIYLLISGHNKAEQAALDQAFALEMLEQKGSRVNAANEQFFKMEKARGTSALILKQYEIGIAQTRLNQLAAEYNAQVAIFNLGGKKTPEMAEEQKKLGDEITEVDNAIEVMKVELIQLGKASDTVTPKMVKAAREVKDAWVEAYEKTLELQQYDVPQYRDPNAAPAGRTAGNTDIGPTASPDFLNGLKARHAAFVKYNDMEVSEAAKAAQRLKEIEDLKKMSAIEALSKTFEIAAGLFEQNTIAYKLMAAAQAGMDTYRAANVALASAPPPYNFALMGVTIAAGLMNVAKIAGFANGGIVPGASFSGDKINARLNSGEMVLNASQQAQLFAIANGGTGSAGGSVRFEIEGTKLIGVLSNTGRKNKNTR